MVAAPKNQRHLWVLDRGLNVAEVFDTQTGRRVNTVDLVGTTSGDPAPDLADLAPNGLRIFVSLRGPNPLTGDPHVATGGTPGLGIIKVKNGGKGGDLKSVLPISNLDASNVERADPHGTRVRLK